MTKHFAQPNQEIPAEQQAGAGGVPHARVGTFSIASKRSGVRHEPAGEPVLGKQSLVGTFSYPLSFEEQRALTNEQMEAYIEWIFSRPLRRPMTDEERLDRDYDMVGSLRRYELGE